jgi:hypothetical protein
MALLHAAASRRTGYGCRRAGGPPSSHRGGSGRSGILIGVTVGVFNAIGIDIRDFVVAWLLPCGAAAAVVVAAWLVEAKQSVNENMAPVLTRLFTPLFTAALLAFLGAAFWTRSVIDVERDVLILFDLVLVVEHPPRSWSCGWHESGRSPRKANHNSKIAGTRRALARSQRRARATGACAFTARVLRSRRCRPRPSR